MVWVYFRYAHIILVSSSDGLAPEDGLIPVACMMAQVFKDSSKVDIASTHGLHIVSAVNTSAVLVLQSVLASLSALAG